MNLITYLKPVPLYKTLPGYVLIFLGLVCAVFVNFIAGPLLIFIGVNLASTEGTQIDFVNRRYRILWSLMGIHIGKWQPVPDFEYASVFSTVEIRDINVASIVTTARRRVILVNLFYGNRHLTFFNTTDKNEALKVAEHFRLVFNIGVLDATGPEKIWLHETGLLE